MKLRGQLYVTTLIMPDYLNYGRFSLMKSNNYVGDKYNILSIFQGKFKDWQGLALERQVDTHKK